MFVVRMGECQVKLGMTGLWDWHDSRVALYDGQAAWHGTVVAVA
jgi:hypothetical protein